MPSTQQPTFRVQSQIKENATRLQDALADLKGWETDIKKKDKQIRRSAIYEKNLQVRIVPWYKKNGDRNLRIKRVRTFHLTPKKGRTGAKTDRQSCSSSASIPSVRQTGIKTSDKPSGLSQGNIESVENVKTSAASHAHDRGYAKWEKFDVEAALHDTSSSEDERAEKNEGRCAKDQAQTERCSNYNQSPSRQQHQQLLTPATIVGTIPKPTSKRYVPAAIGSESVENIEASERERGNTFFQSGDFQEAIKAYTKCLLINKHSLAALSNRAMAHIKLKEYAKAEADCTLALKLDATHLKTLLRRATARNALGKHRSALVDLLVAGRQGDNPEAVKAEKETRRMIRTAILRCPKVKVAVKIAELPSVIPVNKGPLVHAGASSEQDVSVLIPTVDKTATVNDSEFKCVLREEDKSNGVHENILEGRVKQEELDIEGGDKQPIRADKIGMLTNRHPSITSVDMVAKTSNLHSQRRPPIPRTSYDMDRLWRNMKWRPNEERLAWLARFKQSTWSKVLDHKLNFASNSKVFGLSTDGEILGQVLRCLCDSDSDRLCTKAMCGLSQAQGMKVVAMTLQSEARVSLAELFKRVVKSGMVSPEEATCICDVLQLPQL